MKALPAAVVLLSTLNFQLATCFAQGSLTPPGAPAPTMKTLDQLEPRTPLDAAHTTSNAANQFIISQPGSYYLTGNLTGVSNKNGISIQADHVTLDLSGFVVSGVSGSLDGVTVSGTRSNLVVRHGTVRNWGGSGANLFNARDSNLTDLHAAGNGGTGLQVGAYSNVSGCSAAGNNNTGISAGLGCLLSECTARTNTNLGITTGPGCTVSRSNSTQNYFDGISTGASCTIRNCTSYANGIVGVTGATGISAGDGSNISGCTADENTADGIFSANDTLIAGCTVRFNRGDGIGVGTRCHVVGNSCVANGANAGSGAGIHVTSGGQSRIEDNNVIGNDRGIQVDAAGNLIIKNSASGNGAGTANNYIFTGTQIFGSTNMVSGVVTTDPWRNFNF